MCNLNIIVKKDYLKDLDKMKKTIDAVKLYSFLCGVTNNSYEINNEGDGIYLSKYTSKNSKKSKNEGVLIKGKKKIKYDKLIEDIANSNFVITHQRIATSGKTPKYTQPFENGSFVLAHNGVMSDFTRGEHSDTYGLFNDFNEEFKKSRKKTRTRRITQAIKKLLDKKAGMFSIAIYDKVEKSMYYFKNFSTSISFYRDVDKKFLYIATNDDNNIFLKIFPNEFEEFSIDARTIYKIVVEDKIKIYPVGEIADYEFVSNSNIDTDILTNLSKLDKPRYKNTRNDKKEYKKWQNNGYTSNYNSGYNKYNQQINYGDTDDENYISEREACEEYLEDVREQLAEIKLKCGTFLSANVGYCKSCGRKTYNMEPITFRRVCDDCYIKDYDLEEFVQEVQNIENDQDAQDAQDVNEQQIAEDKQLEKQLNTNGGGKNGVSN